MLLAFKVRSNVLIWVGVIPHANSHVVGNPNLKGSLLAITQIVICLACEFSAMVTPTVLYRVFDDSSVSKFVPNFGFVAGDPTWTYNDWCDGEKMCQALNDHLGWYNRNPTPFISTFNSAPKALHEANRRVKQGYGNVHIAQIDVKLLRDAEAVIMGPVTELAAQYSVISRWISGAEYLVLSYIPSGVIRIFTVDEFVKPLYSEVCRRTEKLIID